MAYIDRVPIFKYILSCSHEFWTRVACTPDSEGVYWFYCHECHEFIGHSKAAVREVVPLSSRGKRRLGATEVAALMDTAIVKDRIAKLMRRHHWDTSAEILAMELGVSAKLVRTVGQDIGCYDGRGIQRDE